MDNGWIIIHRKIQDWEWYQDPKMVLLFLHLLLSANHEPGKWQGQTIERGQLITGLDSLHEKTGISVQSIRTCLSKLKSTGEITSKSTNKFRIITLLKYNDYQDKPKKSTSKLTGKLTGHQQTTNKQLTANNNNNNNKQESGHTQAFDFFTSKEKQVELFKWLTSTGVEESLARTELWEFIKYWQETDAKGKQRWEGQKFFDVKRRVGTWFKNIK